MSLQSGLKSSHRQGPGEHWESGQLDGGQPESSGQTKLPPVLLSSPLLHRRQSEAGDDGLAHQNSSQHSEGEREASQLVETAAHGGPQDHPHPEGHLHHTEHGGHRAGEHLGHHGEAGRQEGRVADSLDDPDEEGERYEGVDVGDVVEETEADTHTARGEDPPSEGPVDPQPGEESAHDWGDQEHHQLEYPEDKTVLCGAGPLPLRLRGIKWSLNNRRGFFKYNI